LHLLWDYLFAMHPTILGIYAQIIGDRETVDINRLYDKEITIPTVLRKIYFQALIDGQFRLSAPAVLHVDLQSHLLCCIDIYCGIVYYINFLVFRISVFMLYLCSRE
jgi:hypothetical protein